jgi:hypothetical protein
MIDIRAQVAEISHVAKEQFETEITASGRPVIMRGLCNDWPIVEAARQSPEALGAYLKGHASDADVEAYVGNPAMQGRYFYNDDMSEFNFRKGATTLSNIVDELLSMQSDERLMIYAGSAPVGVAMPDFARDNPMPLLNAAIEPRIWLGNRSRVAAHYDNSRNIACCVAGTRRFTLFPPDQIGNLYIGPLEFTMAGPPASMVDFHAPDYERFPKFREAEKAGMVAELQPGDALYIPSLWWHHVEAEGAFNLLVNYWWKAAFSGSVFESVMLAMLDLRDQPEPEKQAWRAFFDHFVFGKDAQSISEHLPPKWRTVTGANSAQRNAMVLQFIMNQLSQRK